MSQNTETLKSLVERWRIGPQPPKAPPKDNRAEAWLGGVPNPIPEKSDILSNTQREEFEFNHLFHQVTANATVARPAPSGWFAKDVVVNAEPRRTDPVGGRNHKRDRIEQSSSSAAHAASSNDKKVSHAEGFFDAFCAAEGTATMSTSPSIRKCAVIQQPRLSVNPRLTGNSDPVRLTLPQGRPASLPSSGTDITVLLDGPRPSGFTDTSAEDEQRMSSLMDAPTSAYQPLTVLGEKEIEAQRLSGAVGKDSHLRVAASRHLSIPQSQHTPTVGAMVRMLCTSYDKFDQRLEGLRAEEAAGATKCLVESLNADEIDNKVIDGAKWRLFDVILSLQPQDVSQEPAFGLGMVHITCQVVGYRPKTTPTPSPLSVISKAATEGQTVFSLLMPSAQYFMLSLDAHKCVGIAMPFSVSCVYPTGHEGAQSPSHIIILPSFNLLPLPIRSVVEDGNPEKIISEPSAQPEPFRFYGNPLAAHGDASNRSPSKGRSQSRADHVDTSTGFPCGPYPTEGNGGTGGGWEPAEDDWHVPIETLEALSVAYETQMSTYT